jgi:flavin reductase (DIM6/NTAB) family NADH-FMN oxidoreductase RutF
MSPNTATLKKPFPLADVYRLLEPGPVVLLTTAHRGNANVMPMSWHMMMEFEPPLVGCIVSNRNYSFELLRRSGECVINIPTVKLIKQAVACGNCSGLAVDKFSLYGLTPAPAARVKAPLIDECPVNLECVIADRRMVNRYNLFVLEVVKAWRAPRPRRLDTFHHEGWGEFMLAGRTRKLASRMK